MQRFCNEGFLATCCCRRIDYPFHLLVDGCNFSPHKSNFCHVEFAVSLLDLHLEHPYSLVNFSLWFLLGRAISSDGGGGDGGSRISVECPPPPTEMLRMSLKLQIKESNRKDVF